VAQELIVPTHQNGKKLESFLTRSFPVGYVRKLFHKNAVRLNGKRAKARDLVQPGDRVELFFPLESETSHAERPRAKSRGIDVLFENAELLVINKAAGLAVHEANAIAKNRTLLGHLESGYQDAPFKPRLVHRLDMDTSGVLLVAKNEEVRKEIETLFEQGNVEKEYLCLIVGRPLRSSGTIDFPLTGREGKPVRAITHFRVERRYSRTTLIRVTTETGRMHQIRLHFAKLGYPVVLDNRHGDFNFNKHFRKRFGLKRQFLHAARLSMTYRGKSHTWAAPLPDDLSRTLQALADEQRGPVTVYKPT
jgi:23S rRNA pseudouridine955/2504/2580 synthase